MEEINYKAIEEAAKSSLPEVIQSVQIGGITQTEIIAKAIVAAIAEYDKQKKQVAK